MFTLQIEQRQNFQTLGYYIENVNLYSVIKGYCLHTEQNKADVFYHWNPVWIQVSNIWINFSIYRYELEVTIFKYVHLVTKPMSWLSYSAVTSSELVESSTEEY